MIEKIAEYVQDDYDFPIFSVVPEDVKELEKTASYAGEVARYLDNLEREKGHIYALINALTAGEYYGPNRNGDFFPEEALKKYHDTFVQYGHVYKHHVNKDPEKSMGKVIFSCYNDDMKRVELVVKLKVDHADVQKIIEALISGGPAKVKTSMACKVPMDFCSITGKAAKTRDQYSDFLKYQMNKILPDGRRVYAINKTPRFFDISLVTIPADPVSSFMVPIGLEQYLTKTASSKEAQIEKEVDTEGELDFLSADPKELILLSQKRFSDPQLKKLAEFPLNETLSTFLALRVMPVKEDFQKLALYNKGMHKLAEELEENNTYFSTENISPQVIDNIDENNVNEKIASIFIEEINDFCLTKPTIINRLLDKQGSFNPFPSALERTPSFAKQLLFDDKPQPAESGVQRTIPLFMTIGTLYAGYAKLFSNTASISEFSRFVGRNPWVGTIIGGAVGYGIQEMQKNILDPVNESLMQKESFYKGRAIGLGRSGVEKGFLTFGIAAPITYYQSAKAEAKARRGIPLSASENIVRKHPFMTALGTTVTARSLMSGIGSTIRNSTMSREVARNATKNAYRPFPGSGNIKMASANVDNIEYIYHELIS